MPPCSLGSPGAGPLPHNAFEDGCLSLPRYIGKGTRIQLTSTPPSRGNGTASFRQFKTGRWAGPFSGEGLSELARLPFPVRRMVPPARSRPKKSGGRTRTRGEASVAATAAAPSPRLTCLQPPLRTARLLLGPPRGVLGRAGGARPSAGSLLTTGAAAADPRRALSPQRPVSPAGLRQSPTGSAAGSPRRGPRRR